MKAVRIGNPRTITPVRMGDPTPGTPVVVGAGHGAATLDELRDVDGAAAAPTGAFLVKDPDGQYRGRLVSGGGGEQVDWFTGQGPPPAVIPGAGPGDMYIDTLTGWLYRLQ